MKPKQIKGTFKLDKKTGIILPDKGVFVMKKVVKGEKKT